MLALGKTIWRCSGSCYEHTPPFLEKKNHQFDPMKPGNDAKKFSKYMDLCR